MPSGELLYAREHFDIATELALDPKAKGYGEANVYHAHGSPVHITFPDKKAEDDELRFDPERDLLVPSGTEDSPLITLAKGVHAQAANILFSHGLRVRLLKHDPTPEELAKISQESIGLGFRTHEHDLLGRSPDAILQPMTAVGIRAGIGVSDEVTEAFNRNGSVIARTPGPNRFAVASWTFHKIVELLRRAPFDLMRRNMGQLARDDQSKPTKLIKAKAQWSVREHNNPLQWPGNGVGIVGVGGIGSYLAELLLKEGANVVTHDINETKMVRGARPVDSLGAIIADDALRVITLHPSGEKPVWTSEHTQLLREKHRALADKGIKKTWILLNTARGKNIENERDIQELVDEGILEVVVLDVFHEEDNWYSDPLYKQLLGNPDRYDLSPHALGSSTESEVGNAEDLGYSMLNFLLYGAMREAMNAPRFPAIDGLFDGGRAQVILLNLLHGNRERVISDAKDAVGGYLKPYGLRENVENSTLRNVAIGDAASMYSAELTFHHNGSGPQEIISQEVLQDIVNVVNKSHDVRRAWVTEFRR